MEFSILQLKIPNTCILQRHVLVLQKCIRLANLADPEELCSFLIYHKISVDSNISGNEHFKEFY